MVDSNPSTTLASAFPAPPPFYKHFTSANLARLKETQNTATPTDTTSPPPPLSPTQLSTLPPELLYLIPPLPPPPSTTHTTFSHPHDLTPAIPTLASRGLEQIPLPAAEQDPTAHALTLTRSLLLSFLELINTLSLSPALAGQKVEDLRILFVNLHDLVNRQRAHGAREALIGMMEGEVRRRRGEVERIRALGARVGDILEGLGAQDGLGRKDGAGKTNGLGVAEGMDDVDVTGRRGREKEKEKEKGKERRIFDALDELDID